jgi:protein-tyrosine phosphatase
MSQISENLWQGGTIQDLVLPNFIENFVSLYPWESYEVRHELNSCLYVRMYDDVTQSTAQVLDIASWVNSCRRQGVTAVVCQAGLNRSSLVVGTAMVLAGEMTGEEAVNHIRSRRSPACLCNPAFERWLAALELT